MRPALQRITSAMMMTARVVHRGSVSARLNAVMAAAARLLGRLSCSNIKQVSLLFYVAIPNSTYHVQAHLAPPAAGAALSTVSYPDSFASHAQHVCSNGNGICFLVQVEGNPELVRVLQKHQTLPALPTALGGTHGQSASRS